MSNEQGQEPSPLGLQKIVSILVVAALAVAAFVVSARAQDAPAAPSAPSPTAEATPTPSAEAGQPAQQQQAAPSPIPLAEVVAQAETVQTTLRDVEASAASDSTDAAIEAELPVLSREIGARLEENARLLNARPSLETLRNLEADWNALGENLPAWKRDLTARATQLERELTRLASLEATWQKTLESARGGARASEEEGGAEAVLNTNAPPEIIQRIEATVAAIKATRERLERSRAHVLALQGRVAEQSARVAEALAAVEQVRQDAVNRLFVRDSPAIWNALARARAPRDILRDSRESFSTQWTALTTYSRRQAGRYFLHASILTLLVFVLLWARRRVKPWVEAEPNLMRVAKVFELPVMSALLLSILLSGWIYPQAPRLLSALLGAAALIPAVLILRRLVERHLYPVLSALVVFFLVDQLRVVASSLPFVSRTMFLAEMLGGILFLTWFLRSGRMSRVAESERRRLWKSLRVASRVALVVFVAAFVANALGFVSLGDLLGNAVLGSAYAAILLYAAVKIIDGLFMFAARVRPLSMLGMVNRHRLLLRRRVRRVLRWIATFIWLLYTLELLSLRAPVAERLRGALAAELSVGAISISLGDVVIFALTVWAAFLLSRFIRFMLEEDIYPRVEFARGIPYAVSTMLHYAILLVGFLVAVAALGVDMTKFTILAGAFGVGLGFGLQNIVNNFVSGLILLFERPVKVGDVVQLGERSGDLRRIGLRASVLRTWEGSEVIVPNGNLISEEVVNWTLSDQQRRMEINVGVAYGTDPERVIELLTRVAESHPEVMKEPAPQTLFIGFGDSALDFQLRAWTMQFERWMVIRSELTVGVNAALRDAGISIPFPQRDLHIQTIKSEVLRDALGRVNGRGSDSGEEERTELGG